MCAGAGTSVFSRLSVNSSNHARDLANVHPIVDCHPSFYFGLGFLGVIRTSFLEPVRHFALTLDLLKTNPVMSMLKTNCYQLADSPGTTRGTKLSVLHKNVFASLVKRGLWPLTHSQEYRWSSQSFPSDRTASVSSSDCSVTKRSRSWTSSCASSCVGTSPLAHVSFLCLGAVPFCKNGVMAFTRGVRLKRGPVSASRAGLNWGLVWLNCDRHGLLCYCRHQSLLAVARHVFCIETQTDTTPRKAGHPSHISIGIRKKCRSLLEINCSQGETALCCTVLALSGTDTLVSLIPRPVPGHQRLDDRRSPLGASQHKKKNSYRQSRRTSLQWWNHNLLAVGGTFLYPVTLSRYSARCNSNPYSRPSMRYDCNWPPFTGHSSRRSPIRCPYWLNVSSGIWRVTVHGLLLWHTIPPEIYPVSSELSAGQLLSMKV